MDTTPEQKLYQIAESQLGYFAAKRAITAGYLSKSHMGGGMECDFKKTNFYSVLLFCLILSFIHCGSDGTTSSDTSDSDSDSAIDTTAPTVTLNQISPGGGLVSVTFSEAIDADTLTTDSFTVAEEDGISLCTSVSYDADTLIGTCNLTAPDCATLTNYAVSVSTAVTDSAGNALASTFDFTISSADDTFEGTALTDCWTGADAPLSIANGELTYFASATDGTPLILTRTLSDTVYSTGVHVSDIDPDNFDEGMFILATMSNDFDDPNVFISLTHDVDDVTQALVPGYDNKVGEGGVTSGDSVALPGSEFFFCLLRDETSVRTFYSTDGENYAEMSTPEHALSDGNSSVFYFNFVDTLSGASEWSPKFSAIKFLNFDSGDTLTCPTF